jgi:putative glutamine amidotransferase
MAPIIGISQSLDDRGRWRQGREYSYIDRAYASAVEAAGAIPLYLPVQREVDALTERIDALVLPGGDDFLPAAGSSAYPAEVSFDPTPRPQLDFDRRLLASALARGLPILGICYGMQLLALHHGGRLHHHIPIDVPEADDHVLPEAGGRHSLSIEPQSRLDGILGASATVNSLHHQAVSEPGEGLVVSARSEDGLVEAIEKTDGEFLMGVQWHPEKLEGEPRVALFRALAAAAQAFRSGPGS